MNPAAQLPSPRLVSVHNPASGELIGQYPEQSVAQARAAIHRARDVQPAWANTPLTDRRRCIAKLQNEVLTQADEIAQLISNCVGKTRMDALATEVLPTVMGSRWYERHAKRFLKTRRLKNGSLLFFSKRSCVHRLPWGVIGIISPWNYPFSIPMHEIVPALLAGNTVLFKTAPETLPVGYKIAQLLQQAGLPDGVFEHLNVDGPICGDLFLNPGGVNKLFFTGSVRVGKLLAEKAAHSFIPISLELGGKDAMIVCADADLERAAAGAVWAGLSNSGQTCAGVERVYVHHDVYAPFMELLTQKVQNLRVGRDTDFGVDIGPLCTDRQAKTVRHHLEEALQRGAVVAAQAGAGIEAHTQYIPPMVLAQVDHTMAVMREETFGPVLGVMQVESDAEAIRLANDSSYGLTGSVWSRDTEKAAALAEQIHAGAVMVNDHLLSHALTETPWGGFEDSGNGRGHGCYAFESVTTPKVIINDWLTFARYQPFWMPYDQQTYSALKGIMQGLYGRGFGYRLAGLWRALPLLPRMFRKR